ncbi:MAG: hypothetical protein ACLSB9_21470 [Hydrogeniiclostridium mannosilyticum]
MRIKNQVKLYGGGHRNAVAYQLLRRKQHVQSKGWLSITGLKGTDKIELKDSFFKLGAFAPDNSTIAFGKQTPVGRYPVTETGITERRTCRCSTAIRTWAPLTICIWRPTSWLRTHPTWV